MVIGINSKNVSTAILEEDGVKQVVNVYKKVSNLANPFWGLSKNVLDDLKASERDYCVELESVYDTIFLTSEQVEDLIRDKKVAADGAYKIVLEDLRKIGQAFS